ncbi:nucleoside monophosphate kinase [Mycoplasmopsis anatis]|uniref:Adenylate kinase n=1 Tax=Mycoplasmopsis anatis 1340 TaxID=1034808 RepID=F9QD27_9BACT|nr:nucleoside monophosphate kinase [Mycoplasmopsis anatis]AWX70275.1 nucleoside monophosphate kinase [Mycoplasmopsis anatis]EGS29285.1 adenylate kinase [Mycoplasmopsis anatis 1340]VEU74081.1 adenylate kinase [Mycoplasmopsis anatis]
MIKQNCNLIFLGAPGVGKGTVASIIANLTNLEHVSTGNIFRNEIKNKTELGIKVQEIVTTGGYVPDEITNKIVKNKIDETIKTNTKIILDGFPRTIDQAKFLETIENFEYKVVELYAPESIILERLSGRRTCSKCAAGYHIKFKPSSKGDKCENCDGILEQRKDDEPSSIIKRLEIYNEQTNPLIEYFKNKDKLIVVEAIDTPENVADSVLKKIK